MAFAERFEELEIWQEARRLHKMAYFAVRHCGDFAFRDQFRRCALSPMNNIAEGFERRTERDFAHFLDISKGSSGETRSMTYAAEDVLILEPETARRLRDDYESLSRRIAAFQRHLRR